MIHIHKRSAPLNRAKVFVPQEGTDWCVTEKCSSAILISPSTTYFWDFWAPQHMALSRNSIHTAALWYQDQWSCQNNQRCPLGYVKYWDFHAWMWHQDSQCCPGTTPATFIIAVFSLNFIPKYIPIHSGLKKAVTSFNTAGATGFRRMCF